ncbi:MAG TPA: phosphoribosyltransferase family protein [Planctomycetota bacterium]
MEVPNATVLLAPAEIERGLDRLAARLRPRFSGRKLTVVAVLNGAAIFAADLVRRLEPGLQLEFLRMCSYGSGTAPAHVPELLLRPDAARVRGRHVLLLDDILDTGRTLAGAQEVVRGMGAAGLTSVVLIDKTPRRRVPVVLDDRLLQLDRDAFVVGYGLDHDGLWRNLPALMALESAALEASDA